jgi:hypothetical protein
MSLAALLLLLIVALSPHFLGPLPKEKPRPTRRRYQTDLEARQSTRPKQCSPRNTEKQ